MNAKAIVAEPAMPASVTPLAFFAYNRPLHTERALAALSRCADRDRCRIVIYCDAPRRPEHAAAVADTRVVARRWAQRLGAEVVERTENLGLARSIAGSVGALAGEHGRVIVLEDDLVPTPDFLSFMLAGLAAYADDERVAQISGCLLTGHAAADADGLFLPLTTTWGWATWRRAWTLFRWEDAVDIGELDRDRRFRDRFTLGGAADYVAMLRDRLAGANDSWGILWWFSVARAGKLVLYPRESLIWNGGFDNSGVHCGGTARFEPEAPAAFRAPRLSRPIRLPAEVRPDDAAMAAVRRQLQGAPSSGSPVSAAARLGGAARATLARWVQASRVSGRR